MATIKIANNFVNSTPNTVQNLYTPTEAVVIDAITANNNSSVNASYSLYIKSGTSGLQPLIKDKIVVWGTNDLAIGAVNHVIPQGSSLQVECSAIDSIYFTVTGHEV